MRQSGLAPIGTVQLGGVSHNHCRTFVAYSGVRPRSSTQWLCAPGGGGGEAVAVHPQRRFEEPQVEEEEEEEELVSNCQPIGLHSSAVCGGESE